MGNKTNYVVHYRNLQFCFSLGMKLTKMHKLLKLKQPNCMKKYIDFNTQKRANAANSFKKDFFKLVINSVYGETMENFRNRINFRLVNNEKVFIRCTNTSRPTYITHQIFAKNYVAIHEIKPVYLGLTVLELRKWFIYDFHYNFIEKNFDTKLLFTDTHSLTYEIKSEDVYEEFFKRKHLFDFGN